MSNIRTLLLFVVLVLAAGGMRFASLGTWSFGFDERFTVQETELFFGDSTLSEAELKRQNITRPEDSQLYRLPRLAPAAYLVHWVGYHLFGKDEFGSRAMMAVVGSLGVGLVFLLGRPLFGAPIGLLLALLLLLWPDHVLNSQNNRFYILSFLFVSLTLLLGAYITKQADAPAEKSRIVWAAFWLGPVSLLLVLISPFGGVIWGLLLCGIVLESLVGRFTGRPAFPRWTWFWLFLWSALLLGVAYFHILPLVKSWNSADQWGYSSQHAAMAMINSFGWPYFILGLFGLLGTVVQFRRPGHVYWFVCASGACLAVLALPMKIVYNPFYNFLLAFPLWVVVALGVQWLARQDETSPFSVRFLATAWLAAAALLNVPALISYYQDGDRPDCRAAFHYVRDHWKEGDRLTGYVMGAAEYYAPEQTPRIPLRTWKTAERLAEICRDDEGGSGRLWIVLESSRDGLDASLRVWLGRHAVFEKEFRKKRFDYRENREEVYLVDPKNKP